MVPRNWALAIMGAALLLSGCEADGGGSAAGGDAVSPAADAAGGEASGPAGGDAASGTDAIALTAEIGTNTVGGNTPDTYTALVSGGDLEVVWGFQGAWMVVLALRAEGNPGGKVQIRTWLEHAGEERSAIAIKKPKELLPGGDGHLYYYNIFLVTNDWEEYVDELCTVGLELSTEAGEPLLTETVDVFVRPPADE